ncbi:NADPH2:quinone reductase [Oceanobacillus limi]|uniref:NADPH2:quinone reductase n=1 Tax=Oceanobacillus limi TaxID=930131 RepID=A0A1H9Y306_9BACI|nr:zinc-binding dehydrogenase [Oceanobacillus limi]SES63177.1 NADPH2:quinone reductase [Oceanobacillus limi]
MKAIIQKEYGSADVLSYTEIDLPKIGENEVLIKAKFTSVNYADIKKRLGNKGQDKFPFLLGLDIAGVVEEAADGSMFSKGDRVIAFPKNGSYAEYVVADQRLVFKIPDTLSFKKAATLPTVAILSYMLLHEIGQVKETDTIVIHSAAGGVGSTLVQLAKLAGVKTIIGTVGQVEKVNYVKHLGAQYVFTYEEFAEEVLKLTDHKGATVIFDSVAGDVSRRSLECLGLYGTLVQFGNSSGKAGALKTSDFHSSCRNLKGFSLGTTRKHAPERLAPVAEEVIDLFAKDRISLKVAKVFPLSKVAEAHRLIESRNYEGKVIIKI